MSERPEADRRCAECGEVLPPAGVPKTHYHFATDEQGKQCLTYRVGSMTYRRPV